MQCNFVLGADATVIGLADFAFTPLLWLPQGPQGCLEKQNYPLSSNLVVWCATIGPKTKNVEKTSEMIRKTTKNDGILNFKDLSPILVHQTAKFQFSGQLCSSRHTWGCQSSGDICIWKIFQLFFECWCHLVKKFVFFKLKPDVPFTILHA